MPEIIHFCNANSRDTYFTVHNVKEAHQYSKGEGIKVGVIDWSFAMNNNKELYSGGIDLTDQQKELYEYMGHGFMMATVLKEIAPECKVYAINAIKNIEGMSMEEQEEKRSEYFIKAVEWAIGNKIDILTYSHHKFSSKYTEIIDNVISMAIKQGIITTFINCDSKSNIYPYGCFKYNNQNFSREPDVNIYHFDYNTLFIEQYKRYTTSIKKGDYIKRGDEVPYFSFSSMSPVLGGFVAILKSINNSLTAEECKDLLIKTSYEIFNKGEHWYDLNPCPRVIDIGKASKLLMNKMVEKHVDKNK